MGTNTEDRRKELIRRLNSTEDYIKGYSCEIISTQNLEKLKRMRGLLIYILDRLQIDGVLTELQALEKKKNKRLNLLLPSELEIKSDYRIMLADVDRIIERAKRGGDTPNDDIYIMLLTRGYANKLAHHEEEKFFEQVYNSVLIERVDMLANVQADNVLKALKVLPHYSKQKRFKQQFEVLLKRYTDVSDKIRGDIKDNLKSEIFDLLKEKGTTPDYETIKAKIKVAIIQGEMEKCKTDTAKAIKREVEDMYKKAMQNKGVETMASHLNKSKIEIIQDLVKILVGYKKSKRTNSIITKPVFNDKDLNDLFDELISFYDRVTLNSNKPLLVDIDSILPDLFSKMELIRAAYDSKQMLTRGVLDQKKLISYICTNIREEDTLKGVEFQKRAETEKDNDTVNVYQEGFLNLFGVHYLPDDEKIVDFKEETQKRIRLSYTPDNVNYLYAKQLDSMAFNIPIKLTPDQQNYLRQLANVILFIEENNIKPKDFRLAYPEEYKALIINKDGRQINIYDAIYDLFNDKKYSDKREFNALKLQVLLGSGVKNYIRYYRKMRNKDGEIMDHPLKPKAKHPLRLYIPKSELAKRRLTKRIESFIGQRRKVNQSQEL